MSARFAPSLPESAVARAVLEDDVPQLEARLVVSRGQALAAGVLFELAPGWHLYWRHPGDTGIAPRLELEVPGHAVGEIVWPAPRTFEEADGLFTTYGYEGRVLLAAPLARIAGEAPGDTVSVRADVLICRTECVPARFSLSTPLALALPEAEQARIDAAFADARARAPKRAAALGIEATAHWEGPAPGPDETGRLLLSLRSCPPGDGAPAPTRATTDTACPATPALLAGPLFIPAEAERLELSRVEVVSTKATGGAWQLAIEALRLESGPTEPDRLRGLVALRDAQQTLHHVEIDLPIGVEAAQAAAPVSGARWLEIFLLALLGGLVLNGMPCVLPVLAIKIVAVADLAEKHAREIRLQGLAYTVGVLGSMGLLAAVVLGLRAAGQSVGWGFQFQEPIFVVAISAVVVGFALNLFGVFEIELGQGRLASLGQDAAGLRRSVFEGLLAVVLATPCTAPFLGTAVGFAFAASGAGIVAIFLAIGLGLASPFLLVSFFPGLARFIPRSGPWMLKLRAGLGFCLLATGVWLLWVLGQTGGAEAVVSTVSMLLGLAFMLWIFGQLQPMRSVWLGRACALGILGLTLVGLNLVELDRVGEATADDTAVADEGGWTAWSEAAVAEALAAGRPGFVVFTADWCLTCKVNERTVLERDDVRAALEAGGYALFKADWTRRDETIRRKLAEFGRAGVPLYLVYSPASPGEPRVLSELLTRAEVLTALAPRDRRPRT
jgi:thiol:disulfide interchange protein DsbD